MAQIATTSNPAEATQAIADRSAGTAREMVLKGNKPTLRLVEPTPMAEDNPASFWLTLAGEQMTQNIEVLRKLATSRDWREALAIQNGFARDSYARLARGMSCHLGLSAHPMTRPSQSLQSR